MNSFIKHGNLPRYFERERLLNEMQADKSLEKNLQKHAAPVQD